MADLQIIVEVDGQRAVDQLDSKIKKLSKTSKVLSTDFDRTERSAKRFNTTALEGVRGLNQYGKTFNGTGRNLNRFNMQLQQVGYQVGDFAVQIQGGTNAMVALGQQGSQLLSVFGGAAGALAGAGLAIASAFLAPLLQAKQDAQDTTEVMNELKGVLGDYDSIVRDAAMSTSQLSERFGSFAGNAGRLLGVLKEIQRVKLGQAISQVSGIGPLSSAAARDILDEQGEVSRRLTGAQAGDIYDFFDLNRFKTKKRGQIGGEFAVLSGMLASAKTFKDQEDALQGLLDFTLKYAGAYEDMTGEQKSYYEAIAQAQQLVHDAANAERIAEEAANDKAKKIQEDEFKAAMKASQMQLAAGQVVRDAEEKAEKQRKDEQIKRFKFAMQASQMQLKNGQQVRDAEAKAEKQAAKLQIDREKAMQAMQEDIAAGQKTRDAERARRDKKAHEVRMGYIALEARSQMLLGTSPMFINMDSLEVAAQIHKDKKAAEEAAAKIAAKALQKEIDLTRELTDAQKQQVEIADTVSGAFGGFFMDLVDGTTSAKDAFRSMATDIIQQLYRILVVEQLVQSIAGAITGSFAPASAAGTGGSVAPPRRPTGVFNRYEGGGYTGSGPRSGGLDGKGGFMAMLHPRETVVDHTKGQSAGSTVVNQTFNISANTSDDTKRLITQTIAQASPAIINQSVGAVMNQRRRGGSMKSAFG
jgi:hypothetical protein